MLRLLMYITTVDVKDIPGVKYYQTDNFEIEFTSPLESSWCVDGEELLPYSQKYTFTVKKEMKMLVPKENTNKLFAEQKEETI